MGPAWVCLGTLERSNDLKTGLRCWLRKHWYTKRPSGRVHEECWDPECLVVWPMATRTTGFTNDCLGTSTQDSPGTLFLSEAIAASALLHGHRA